MAYPSMYSPIVSLCLRTLAHTLLISGLGLVLLLLIRSMSSIATSSISNLSSIAYTRLRSFVACSSDSTPDIMRGMCVCSIYIVYTQEMGFATVKNGRAKILNLRNG